MKHSSASPLGSVMMASGIVLLVITAVLPRTFPWLCVFLGLSGVVLFFVGFRFLAGPNHILCPQCRKKIYIRNRLARTLATDGVLNCPHCGSVLRTDSRTII